MGTAAHTSSFCWQVDIFSVDLLLYPIHLGTHWCLAAVDNRHQTVAYYDSLGGRGRSCLNTLRQYLVAEHRDKKKTELSLDGWRDVTAQVSWPRSTEHIVCIFSISEYSSAKE